MYVVADGVVVCVEVWGCSLLMSGVRVWETYVLCIDFVVKILQVHVVERRVYCIDDCVIFT